MRKLIKLRAFGVLAASLLTPALLSAQDTPLARTATATIIGVVAAEPTGDLLAATAVELRSAPDSALVAQTVTNAEGAFRIERLAAGEYYLRLVHLDHGEASTAVFELVDAETRDLGTVHVPVEVIEHAPIEVSVERTPVMFEADRTSYIVGLMPGAEGASVTELIRSIPEMSVDIDGRVRRRGNEPAIYINDRPAPMSREALAMFLEQLPADILQKIEVMDNPPARYRAEGTGGVINIVLKEGVDLGLSGSAFINAGTRGQYGAGAHGTFQRGDLHLDGNAFVSLVNSESNGFDLRQNLIADPAFLRQDSWSDRSGLSGNVHLNARYQVTERVRLYTQGFIAPSNNTSTRLTTTTYMDETEAPILVYDRASEHDLSNASADITSGLEYQWGAQPQTLKIDVRLRNGTRSTGSREQVDGDGDFADSVRVPAELTLVDENDLDRTLSLDVDYTRPWGEGGRIELGFQSTRDDSDRDRTLRAIEDPLAQPDGERTDREFDQEQRSYSAYTTLQRQVGKVGVQVGLRAERFELGFATAGEQPFSRRFLDFFPSANLLYQLGPAKHLRLSYSRRIGRPDAAVLDPTDRSTDPLNRIVGNPDITPQYSHSVMLNGNWSGSKGNLGLALHYQKTTNEWMPITTVDDQGVSTRTHQNLASSASYGASLSYSMQRPSGWFGHISLNGMRHVRDADNLAEHYSGGSFRWSAQANLSAPLFRTLAAEGTFSYTAPVDLPQGRSDASYTADFGVRYRLLDNRASVRLSLQDPLGLRKSSSRLQDSTYIQIGRSRESTRSAQIQLSYVLGGPGGMRRGRP